MKRLAIRQGWTTFFLVSLVVFTATWSIQRADWADGLEVLTGVTWAGLFVGLALAQMQRLPSPVAHLIALAAGAVVVLYQVTEFLSDSLGSRREKLDYLWTRWQQWYGAISQGERADDLYLFILLMAVLLWLLSYLSIWFVFRSRWIWLPILLPGIILLLNLGYSRQVPATLVVVYLFAALLLLMRFSFLERERSWRSSRIPYPDTLAWRGLWVASYLAVAVIMFGWIFPLTTQSQAVLDTWNQVNSPWRNVENRFNSWFGSLRGPGAVGISGFASFSDSFDIGGPLQLSDRPVVLVRGDVAPYLVAHRYNIFTGSGWESDISDTFQPMDTTSRQQGSPLWRLPAGETFPVPEADGSERVELSYSVEILRPRGAVVYSTEQLAEASVPAQVQVAWYSYRDQALDVQAATEESTPPYLWPLVSLLKTADFTPPEIEDEPTPTPDFGTFSRRRGLASPTPDPGPQIPGETRTLGTPSEYSSIQAEQTRLAGRSITTSYELDENYQVSRLVFSGQLPVLSDVEAIFAQNGVRRGDTYDVTSLVSNATAEQLRGAGNVYPSEITSRYLSLPSTVTSRTRELARELAAGHETPYDIAANVERYLRENMVYREDVRVPPEGRDIVDYFLFDSREGYCTYYSSAMIELLRVVGIPSRIAVGFYPAEFDANAGGFLYRDLNAHAWVEVYFPSYGWVPFEPTAARSPIERRQPEQPAQAGDDPSLSGDLGAGVPAEFDPLLDELNSGISSGGVGVASDQGISRAGWVLRIGFLALVVLAGAFAYLWLRGLRGLSPTTQFFTKMQRGASWGGVPIRASMTPYEYAALIAERIPGARPHVRYLADLYVREQYGHKPVDQNELSRARNAWLRLRGLFVKFFVAHRWRRSAQRESADG